MIRYAALVVLCLAQAGFFASAAHANGKTVHGPRPPATYTGQWYTTPSGCSYSRAQAPGYPASWHLITNPHHIGKPTAKANCPTML
ncbi:hypothetical protein LA6_000551 [Marinibacterium anthonyi]|nr:hypothetical protein LA6_000551 [Marinibacterium anthonyi]